MLRSILHLTWKIPKWLFELLSWGKSFKNNPILGNYWLNRCGLHVFRVLLAHFLFRFRLLLLSPLVSSECRREFINNGYILKENFLPQVQFTRLVEELNKFEGPVREVIEGTTVTQRIFMDFEERKRAPEFQRFVRNEKLDRLMRFCSSKNRPPLFYIENLCNHENVDPRPDPQRDLHADTFHPCVKAWLYIDDTSDKNGSYVYVSGSQRLTWQRLTWEYKESLEACKKGVERASGRYWDGSFRINKEDLDKMGCQVKKLSVPGNTLVVGNVYGFHCRGEALEKSNRMTIWMQARDNPFNPLFTPFPKITAKAFEGVWKKALTRLDRGKVKSGEQRNYYGRLSRLREEETVD
ncbi:phytanoyl-CoA dioxygenase family protein [Microbulbifer sp. OS29]|uniref:Phytanoyl-CoA dioxygenase family protein n=1 Tax=Microbulbifer okhotskensis TaxID=2926617 RepID=A0A9X2J4U1_9GAMM|nr:phytanoyl-CoA dioxygenase family protein [Microbulbifer okhotskensis]MCO1334483.1 phytanoyl-CoA dioxygenase family protein [Microbulbifer okhotskensis]